MKPLGYIVGAFLLSACGGSASGIGMNAAASHNAVTHLTSSCLTATCIYATDLNYGKGTIAIFAQDATGNVAPLENIGGHKIPAAGGIAVGSDHEVYGDDGQNNASSPGMVLVWAAGTYGKVKPARTISGSSTGLDWPANLTVDQSGKVFVANSDNGGSSPSITVYAAGASGNATPMQTIGGSNTGLSSPYGVALDSSENVYVANCGSSPYEDEGSITVYAAGANGNVAPIASISGSQTFLACPQDVALDSAGNIYVANSGSVTVYTAGASGNVAPIRTIQGARTKLDDATGIAVDAAGKIYVANRAAASITVYAAGSNGNVRPSQRIKGSATTLKGWANAVAVE